MDGKTEKGKSVLLGHGSGGKLTGDLIRSVFLKFFKNSELKKLSDSALLDAGSGRIAFTTDSYVVKPVFFPGGSIGHLAVCGTVNDLSVSFARPLCLSCGFIIEEGFPMEKLKTIAGHMAEMADLAGVSIVTGDTKVVERGSADQIFINTSGIGIITGNSEERKPPAPGDIIIINGPLGDHGIAVLSARENLPMESDTISDTAPLNLLISPLLKKFPKEIKFMRDVTRGGLATVMNEFAEDKPYGINLMEEKIPVNEGVASVCELLGFDPLYLANEGKAVFVVDGVKAPEILSAMKTLPYGEKGEIIGEITGESRGKVVLKTRIGGRRIVDSLIADQLPRIC